MRLLDDRKNDTGATVDAAVSTFELCSFDDMSHITEQHGPFRIGPHRNVPQVFQHSIRFRSETAEDSDWPFCLAFHRESAAGVDVALFQRLLNFLERHSVFQQSRWIDSNLILLLVATKNERFCHAGHLEHSRPDHPVRCRPQ